MNKPYVNIEELSRYVGVTITTLRSWVRTGAIPRETYIRAGQTYRFHLADVEAHLRGLRIGEPEEEEVAAPEAEETVAEAAVVETMVELEGEEEEVAIPTFDLDLDDDA
jgi:excisionase family DNA binding protein